MIEYITGKYGEDKVAKIGTYGTNKAKSILKDVGRVMNINHDIINNWNKDLPSFNGEVMPLDEAIHTIPTFVNANKMYPDLFDLAIDLEGMPKSAGVHPCGTIISSDALYDSLPLTRAKDNTAVTQYEGGPLEDLGLLKFDILGIKYLSVLRVATELIKERHDTELDLFEMEPDDKETFELISRGETFSLFQLSSSGMQDLFKGINNVDFDTLVAGISLYRPGPMEHIPEYQDRANGLKAVTYPHPVLEEILGETYGVAIYQEQIMKMTQVLGGYSAGQADSFRKAIVTVP